MNSGAPFVSVIVPVLNEARLLGDFLRQVRALSSDLEIIVVDGGSGDGSVPIADSIADQVIVAPRGRAPQMNAGAQIARGRVLWFLHADLRVPPESVECISAALADSRTAGGYFRLRYPRREWIYRVSDLLGNVGVGLFGFALGDHGIFCRREAFMGAGGYPDVPILEDAALCRRLNRRGGMRQLREAIMSDPRTFEKCGRYRTTAVYFLILALYVVGVPIRWLNMIYRRFHARTREERRGIILTVENEASH
ncbi:MAG TPA: TIGR04283 family arsenosugar biosynthesis glycosyltransferase [Chthoniobacterales bacterium]